MESIVLHSDVARLVLGRFSLDAFLARNIYALPFCRLPSQPESKKGRTHSVSHIASPAPRVPGP